MAHKCPICDKVPQPHPDNPSFPFCSRRCKMVDLGNWFAEGYSLSRPIDPETDQEAIEEAIAKQQSEEIVH